MKQSHTTSKSKILCYNASKKTMEVCIMPFAQILSKIRREKGLTQQELAKQAGVGIAQMRRYESGKSSPTLEIIKNLVKTLGISADELIFDKHEGVPTARIFDRKLLEQFEMIATLNPHDQDAVKTILEGVIIKNKIAEVMPSMSDAAWSREMRKTVSELRDSAKDYSDDDIESIVDQAVTAVRTQERRKVGH